MAKADPSIPVQLAVKMSLAAPEDAASVLEQFVHDGMLHVKLGLIVIESM